MPDATSPMDHDADLPEYPPAAADEQRVAIDALRTQLADLLRRVAEEKARLVLTVDGQPVAALVPYEDFRLIQDLEDQLDHDEAEKAIREADEHGWIPLDQVRKDLGLNR